MRNKIIEEIVCRDRSLEEWEHYSSYQCPSPEVLKEPMQMMLASVQPAFGSCVMLSGAFVIALAVHYSIPAIAVVGDLKILGNTVFKCNGNVPIPEGDEILNYSWDGHCWVEIGGVICDLSIFRSAYNTNRPSLLKQYITSQFGSGKGAVLSAPEDLPTGMEYVPKYVLNDKQLSAIINGLAYQQKLEERVS